MRNYLRAAHYLMSMMRHAYWDPDKLVEYQNRKVREILKYAYENVSFYHEKLNRVGIKPDEVKTVDDLNKLPILTKAEIQKNLNNMISRKFAIHNLRVVSSSGSTGQPLTVYISRKEDEFRKAKHLRANICCGQKPRDRWVVITSPHRAKEVTRLQRILGIYSLTPVSVFDDVAKQVSVVERLRPDVLDGYSSSLRLLAKETEKRGIETINPRFVIGGAELIDGSSRKFIEDTFDAPFYDQYACIEFERMAWQCPEKRGYHIDADSIVMQFVDENGEEVVPGKQGEIVCTSLFNYAMPLLRYAVGDVGVASEDSACSCGRTFPMMKLVEGRKDSFIVLPDGRILSPHVFCLAMEYSRFYDYIDHYRIIQKKVDFFQFHIKMKHVSVDKEAIRKELAMHFADVLKINVNEVAFDVEFVDDIPLDDSGKLTTVVSELRQTL